MNVINLFIINKLILIVEPTTLDPTINTPKEAPKKRNFSVLLEQISGKLNKNKNAVESKVIIYLIYFYNFI